MVFSLIAHWRLCFLEHIVGLKSMIIAFPILSYKITSQITNGQQHMFSTLQSLAMDQIIDSKGFQIPMEFFFIFSTLALLQFLQQVSWNKKNITIINT